MFAPNIELGGAGIEMVVDMVEELERTCLLRWPNRVGRLRNDQSITEWTAVPG